MLTLIELSVSEFESITHNLV